jgi:RNA recognition motif-containing protein
MESATEASNAIKALNDSQLSGRNIVVNEAKARS